MNTQVYDVHFLTPALLAGAYPKSEPQGQRAIAELRASSIRGQLRWWFRFLGGNRDEEERIFGSAREQNIASSGFCIRLVNPPPPVCNPQTAKQLGLHSGRIVDYLAFNLRNREDARSVLPHGKAFQILFINRRLEPRDWKQLNELALLFFQLGSLGTRSRRGFGALDLAADKDKTDFERALPEHVGFRSFRIPSPTSDWARFLQQAGNWLKEKRAATARGNRNSIWGTAGRGSRIASAILLRPIISNDGWQLGVIGKREDLAKASL